MKLTPSRLLWPLLAVAVAAVALAAATLGAPVPLSDLWSHNLAQAGAAQTIFFTIRAPRVLAGLLVGASLAVSGAALQSLFANPLAEPYLLGISAGGALGATLAQALRLPALGWGAAVLEASAVLAFAGALLAAAAVYQLGQARSRSVWNQGGHQSARLLLTGVAFSALLTAMMSLVVTLSGRLELTQQTAFWLLGGLTRATWPQVGVLAVALTMGTALVLGSARDMNALQVGAPEAAALGVNLSKLRRRLLLASALMSAASVAAAGLIGFVGLLAPHLVRLAGARQAQRLVPACALAGAGLLCGCDALARGLAPPREIPVGIITALLGVPLFLSLARRS